MGSNISEDTRPGRIRSFPKIMNGEVGGMR